MAAPLWMHIINYLEISERLGTGGMPTREQLAALPAAGYQVVINLAVPESPNAIPEEAELVRQLGMTYYAVPVIWEQPSAENLRAFFAALEAHPEEKIFAHCAMNMRVSVFVCLYRVLRQGLPLAQALEDVHQIWQPNPTWQAFLEEMLSAGYLPPTRPAFW